MIENDAISAGYVHYRAGQIRSLRMEVSRLAGDSVGTNWNVEDLASSSLIEFWALRA